MPPPPSPLPTNHLTFDTWNSSSTGHQIADPGSSRGNTSWRETRREKLTRQFGVGKGDCTYDSDGEENKGEWVVTQIPADMQKKKQQQRDIRSMFGVSKPKSILPSQSTISMMSKKGCEISSLSSSLSLKRDATSLATYENKKRIRIDHQDDNGNKIPDTESESEPRKQNNTSTSTSTSTSTIFSSLTIHINGQKTPTVSDHKLKHLLISHGANLSLHMHRGVTHVILGEPNTPSSSSSSSSIKSGIKVAGAGAGGGLAAGKLQKEIQRGGWKGVKLVRVQWAMDSIAAGKRLSEAKYAVQLRTNQRSVLAFTSSTSNTISSLS